MHKIMSMRTKVDHFKFMFIFGVFELKPNPITIKKLCAKFSLNQPTDSQEDEKCKINDRQRKKLDQKNSSMNLWFS